jgi:flagellar protein FliT
MKSVDVIATYEAILETSGQMLDAARREDWDGLLALEQTCKNSIERLIADPLDSALDTRLQRRKAEIIRQVLADDAQIRSITEPWVGRLQVFLETTHREHKLRRAYGPAHPD